MKFLFLRVSRAGDTNCPIIRDFDPAGNQQIAEVDWEVHCYCSTVKQADITAQLAN
jgi:hypothetical protein